VLETRTPSAAGRYPARSKVDNDGPVCTLRGNGCLERAKTETAVMRDFMAGQTARLALVDRFLAADRVHDPYPPSYQAPSRGSPRFGCR